ncbi:glycosyl transferases group 1 family protein [Vibrio paracholerae HE-16]|uniref:glycosyltransferase family 4 protein n=1 Tax=Vibrio TaxID=662 RepID=UPI00028D2D53|nr:MULTISPECIES: glycosyltransferase family 4 protein [Vibrio]EKG91178.1 glycosyl transferases group 1 family protein [Vibrio paracholerae HE-16]TXY67877.1 glycosyltransferase family 4 protein [Vibrio cholerae]TXZ61906.1 glycosyltransferase family 4 protein [Vibrio cholerae]BCN16809.1 putative glycogen synthase [Vibrio cholerae]BCN20715.1 putative glycogen synthase [Vibrio cholerae]
MKKVMFYCHVFYPQNTGYSNAFQNLINSILDNDLDLEVTVMTPFPLPDGEAELARDRLKIVRLFPKIKIRKIRYFINDYFYAKKVSEKFKNENYDFLIVETFDQAVFINSLDDYVYEKMAVRIHSTNETEYTFFNNKLNCKLRKYLIKNKISKKLKWVLSTNTFHIDFAKRYYFDENLINIGDKSFFTLPNAVNSFFPDDFSVSEKVKIFSLGRMDYLGNNQKGFTDFIYALKLLPKSVLDKFEIKIVGKGDMRSSLINLCENIDNVTFIEEMSHKEVISTLKSSDVVILPSRYEGLSMFALEGLATGNACLFSKTGGLIDMVDDNGIFFEPQNIESIVSALTDLANLDSKSLIEMKKKSIDICEKKFSSKVVAEKFRTIFDVIVTGNR